MENDEIGVGELEKPASEEPSAKKKPRRNSHYLIPEGISVEPTDGFNEPSHPQKHVPRNRYAERREREGELRVLQGLLLFSIYALFSDDKEKHKKGKNLLFQSLEVSFLTSMHHPSLVLRHHCCLDRTIFLKPG